MLAVIYCEQNLLFVHPDHLCFDRTTYDNINGPAGPIMYPDQIFRDSTFMEHDCYKKGTMITQLGA